MLIEEMMKRNDMATNLCIAVQNSIGKEHAGVFMIEDFESRNNKEFENYCIEEMERLNLDTMIFCGWAFTKEYFKHLMEYEEYQNKNQNSELNVMIFPEIMTHIVFKNTEALKYGLSKLNNDFIKVSLININNISESDNGIEINYFTNTSVKYFEEKPKSLDKIIEDE